MAYAKLPALAAIGFLLLGGCGSVRHHDVSQEADEISAGADWGFLEFAEVRAFRLNWSDENSFDPLVGEGGKLNRTREPKGGVLLNEVQVESLRLAVTGNHPEHLVAMCLYPHHAFAFYNNRGKIVGHIDICFLCSNYRGEPKGFADRWDLEALESLLRDLGMPLSNPNWER